MEPEIDLKNKMKVAKLSVAKICTLVGKPYGTVANWLNGFAPLPYHVRRLILDEIAKNAPQNAIVNCETANNNASLKCPHCGNKVIIAVTSGVA